VTQRGHQASGLTSTPTEADASSHLFWSVVCIFGSNNTSTSACVKPVEVHSSVAIRCPTLEVSVLRG
jgi:hypothetical protein